MRKRLTVIVAFTVLIVSWSCQSVVQVAHTHATSTSFAAVTKLHFPQPWLDQMEGPTFIEQIEVRKVPNSSDDEFLFGGLPYGDNNYAHEVDKNILAPQYARNMFAVNFSGGHSPEVGFTHLTGLQEVLLSSTPRSRYHQFHLS